MRKRMRVDRSLRRIIGRSAEPRPADGAKSIRLRRLADVAAVF